MINRKKFFDSVRVTLFGGKLSQTQVHGMEADLAEWERSGWDDLRWLAYMLATEFHETGKTMQPIKEWGGNDYFVRRYWYNKKVANELGNLSAKDAIDFAGGGKVMITGRRNYTRMGKILGIPLVEHPELAREMNVSVKIMFEGMTTGKSFAGDFTGKHLGNYFNKTTHDPLNARRIINGLDKAELIKGYFKHFYAALLIATA